VTSRSIEYLTLLAVVAMEAGLSLPIISMPAQGAAQPGVLGPFLLVLLLPLGLLAIRRLPDLRDPSYRLIAGIMLALAMRLAVTPIADRSMGALLTWLGVSFVPAALGVALWWRGTSLGVSDFVASDVRTEFSVIVIALLFVVALMRPFILQDPLLLGTAVALSAGGGLIGVALARQDAADAVSAGRGRGLAFAASVLPLGGGVLLVSLLRPALLAQFWQLVARGLELLLLPIGLLIAWLSSFFPRLPAPAMAPPPGLQPLNMPDPREMAEASPQNEWLGWLIVGALLLMAIGLLLVVVRVMLNHWLTPPAPEEREETPAVSVEQAGDARRDAQAFLQWLLAWLRGAFSRGASRSTDRPVAPEPLSGDARAVYRALLEWADRQGVGRRPWETPRQFEARLQAHVAEGADTVHALTGVYEAERYGEIAPPRDRLRRLEQALRNLMAPGRR
jgi:Domain of unknown function (DUF4129)